MNVQLTIWHHDSVILGSHVHLTRDEEIIDLLADSLRT